MVHFPFRAAALAAAAALLFTFGGCSSIKRGLGLARSATQNAEPTRGSGVTDSSTPSSSRPALPDASSSAVSGNTVEIDPNKPLDCGDFVYLWLRSLDVTETTQDSAITTAEREGYIPDGTDKSAPLTVESAARLLTARDGTTVEASHYDWQIADLDKADAASIPYLLTAYARGLIVTDGGSIHPHAALNLRDTLAILARLDDRQRLLPPDCVAPYFEYHGLVEVKRIDPTVVVDLKYATTDNFTGKVHYTRPLCLLDADTARQLKKANDIFHKKDLTLKIWDAYRPVSVQWSLYYSAPEGLKQYAPAPSKNAQHSKGIAADVTLVDSSGRELDMPTGFDDFTEKAHPDYNDLPTAEKQNRDYLRSVMESEGFEVYRLEWWHYYLPSRTSLSISTVELDDFAACENEFYQEYIKATR